MDTPTYDPTTLYGESYQRDALDPKALTAWQAIASVFSVEVAGNRWLDIGCGPGGLLAALNHKGFSVVGIEGSRAALGLVPGVPIALWDLRTPLYLDHFDVVSCFDVAEHVGNADAVAQTCAQNCSGILLFGAAPPGQDGLGHIDCRPHADWTARFAAWDLTLDQQLTDMLRAGLQTAEGANHCWWVEKNLHAYRR